MYGGAMSLISTANPSSVLVKATIAILFWVVSVIVAALSGLHYGARNERLDNFELQMLAENAGKAAQKGAAIEIGKIRVRNTTIQGRVQTVIKDNPVYRDCSHDDATVGMLNSALSGQEPGDRSVPQAVSPKR